MRNEIPGLLTSREIRETINLKPGGEVVIGVTTTIPAESKDEEGAADEEEARKRKRGGTKKWRGASIKVNLFTLSAPCSPLISQTFAGSATQERCQ